MLIRKEKGPHHWFNREHKRSFMITAWIQQCHNYMIGIMFEISNKLLLKCVICLMFFVVESDLFTELAQRISELNSLEALPTTKDNILIYLLSPCFGYLFNYIIRYKYLLNIALYWCLHIQMLRPTFYTKCHS